MCTAYWNLLNQEPGRGYYLWKQSPPAITCSTDWVRAVGPAAGWHDRGDELTPADDRSRLLDIHLQRGAVLEMLGAWAETEADYRAALALAQHPQDLAAAQF